MRNITAITILVLVFVVAMWLALRPEYHAPTPAQNAGTATTTVFATTITTPGGIIFGHDDTYGLAVTPEQILTKAYIPPCDSANPGFDYCLYRVGTDYAGTNFESAGLRIKERADLTSQAACLTTEPAGYSGLVPKTMIGSDYATSVFSPLGDAGAGHFASGALYRLSFDHTCYEFETRIGETQFANYPAGSIQQFTDADRASVQNELMQMLDAITIASTSEQVTFPSL